MSDQGSAPNFHGLENSYEIRGELRGTDATRRYIGRAKDDSAAEVAIAVVRAPGKGDNNALSHFAADSQILQRTPHPNVPRVIEGRWVGPDSFAIVSERIFGETMEERLARGDRFSNPRLAMLLQEISGVLDWARENGVVHRGVTPDGVIFERDTNRVHVSLSPTAVPMSGVPDACTDARTLGALAWAAFTGEPYATGETRSIGEVCPNLATRVVEATDRMLHSKDHEDQAPDIARYLGVIAAGDALKQAEVELSAQKEEYDEEHRAALQACELQRQATEDHAAEQASILAGEREDFHREMEDARAAFAAERAQLEAMLEERKDRLGAVRAELEQQRTELDRRLTELEQYRLEVEKVRDEAMAAREAAKEAQARASEAAAAHAAAAKEAAAQAAAAKEAAARMAAAGAASAAGVAGAAAAAGEASAMEETSTRPRRDTVARHALDPMEREVPIPALGTMPSSAPADVSPVNMAAVEPYKAPKLAKPPKAPKWKKFDPVDLEHTDNVTADQFAGGRPRWMIPAGVAALLLIVVALAFNMMHRSPDDATRLGNTALTRSGPATPNGFVPRGGFLTQSAGGALSPRLSGAPVAANPTPADSVKTVATPITPDSAAALERAKRRAEARAEKAPAPWRTRQPTQAEIDSLNSPASTWNRNPRPAPPPDTQSSTASARADAPRLSLPPLRDTLSSRRDSVARRDTVVRRDSIRPDTGRVRRR